MATTPTRPAAKLLVSTLLGAVVAVIGARTPAHAAVVQPCLSLAAASITFLPILGGNQTYCQSAYGWSDTWFAAGQPAIRQASQDVLAGDNAPGLVYTKPSGAVVGSSNSDNFISPFVDGGTRDAVNITTAWTVKSDLSVTGNVGSSVVTLGGLDAAIRTTVGLPNAFPGATARTVTEQYTFTNNTGAAISDVLFFDYFNLHPDGSTAAGAACGTTTYVGGTAITVASSGIGCVPVVSKGSMKGSATPLAWDLGLTGAVLSDISAGTFNNATGPVTGDAAVAIIWDLGALAIGASTTITLTKDTTAVPEPTSLALLGVGLVGIARLRRRGGR